MTTQQWEFCELALSDWKNRGKGYSYEVYIKYYGPDYSKHYQLSEVEGKNAKILDYNPFTKAMAQLGAGGWELVSHQFASGGASYAVFAWEKRVAVFKRPVQPGRAVDEPKLTDLK